MTEKKETNICMDPIKHFPENHSLYQAKNEDIKDSHTIKVDNEKYGKRTYEVNNPQTNNKCAVMRRFSKTIQIILFGLLVVTVITTVVILILMLKNNCFQGKQDHLPKPEQVTIASETPEHHSTQPQDLSETTDENGSSTTEFPYTTTFEKNGSGSQQHKNDVTNATDKNRTTEETKIDKKIDSGGIEQSKSQNQNNNPSSKYTNSSVDNGTSTFEKEDQHITQPQTLSNVTESINSTTKNSQITSKITGIVSQNQKLNDTKSTDEKKTKEATKFDRKKESNGTAQSENHNRPIKSTNSSVDNGTSTFQNYEHITQPKSLSNGPKEMIVNNTKKIAYTNTVNQKSNGSQQQKPNVTYLQDIIEGSVNKAVVGSSVANIDNLAFIKNVSSKHNLKQGLGTIKLINEATSESSKDKLWLQEVKDAIKKLNDLLQKEINPNPINKKEQELTYSQTEKSSISSTEITLVGKDSASQKLNFKTSENASKEKLHPSATESSLTDKDKIDAALRKQEVDSKELRNELRNATNVTSNYKEQHQHFTQPQILYNVSKEINNNSYSLQQQKSNVTYSKDVIDASVNKNVDGSLESNINDLGFKQNISTEHNLTQALDAIKLLNETTSESSKDKSWLKKVKHKVKKTTDFLEKEIYSRIINKKETQEFPEATTEKSPISAGESIHTNKDKIEIDTALLKKEGDSKVLQELSSTTSIPGTYKDHYQHITQPQTLYNVSKEVNNKNITEIAHTILNGKGDVLGSQQQKNDVTTTSDQENITVAPKIESKKELNGTGRSKSQDENKNPPLNSARSSQDNGTSTDKDQHQHVTQPKTLSHAPMEEIDNSTEEIVYTNTFDKKDNVTQFQKLNVSSSQDVNKTVDGSLVPNIDNLGFMRNVSTEHNLKQALDTIELLNEATSEGSKDKSWLKKIKETFKKLKDLLQKEIDPPQINEKDTQELYNSPTEKSSISATASTHVVNDSIHSPSQRQKLDLKEKQELRNATNVINNQPHTLSNVTKEVNINSNADIAHTVSNKNGNG